MADVMTDRGQIGQAAAQRQRRSWGVLQDGASGLERDCRVLAEDAGSVQSLAHARRSRASLLSGVAGEQLVVLGDIRHGPGAGGKRGELSRAVQGPVHGGPADAEQGGDPGDVVVQSVSAFGLLWRLPGRVLASVPAVTLAIPPGNRRRFPLLPRA